MKNKHENSDQTASFQLGHIWLRKTYFEMILNHKVIKIVYSFIYFVDYLITLKPQRNRPVNANLRTDWSPGEHKSRTGFGFLVIFIAIISYTISSC